MAPVTHKLDPEARKFISHALGADSFEAIALAGDASSRRYMRIVGSKETLILMIWEPFKDDGRYPFLNVLNHFARHGVRVPEVRDKAPELGLVLLEDLGDLTLERKFWENQNQTLALPYYKQSLDELNKIHYAATRDTGSDCVAFQVEFNVEKLLWEMNYGLEHLVEKLCRISLSVSQKAEIQDNFTHICTELHAEPKCICHRDYHSRNIMLKHDKARIIDFQDARMGTIQYDLVSLLHDSYVDLNDSLRNEALEYYLSRAETARGSRIERSHFHSVFRLQMIQRCFKACGSFASFYNMREDLRYLKYLKPTIQKVIQALTPYPRYEPFKNLLIRNRLHEIDYTNPGEHHK